MAAASALPLQRIRHPCSQPDVNLLSCSVGVQISFRHLGWKFPSSPTRWAARLECWAWLLGLWLDYFSQTRTFTGLILNAGQRSFLG
ncbi:hypothetical protein LIER_33684 [Lithospermum erythrorhizon]|uniref:Uncharacterized protein n=1 Tax=Lithospermum erythrorhizon TaxID=34254 RepID=A0AAV3RXD0_LITER